MVQIQDLTVTIRISGELVAQIDEWRRKQPVIPSMASAIRHFLEIGMKKGRS